MAATFETRFRSAGKWMTSWEIIKHCKTVTPSKRLSEIRKKGCLQERPSPRFYGMKEYRYRRAT